MTFDEYQQQAPKTRLRHGDPLIDQTITVLGLAGETGEIVEKWKKALVYQRGQLRAEDKMALANEAGDVLWYLAILADALGFSLSEIAAMNLEKLASRQKRGVQKGAGDNR